MRRSSSGCHPGLQGLIYLLKRQSVNSPATGARRLDDRDALRSESRDRPARSTAEPTTDIAEVLMSEPRLVAVDRPGVAPLTISARLRGQLVYFMTPPGAPGIPQLQE